MLANYLLIAWLQYSRVANKVSSAIQGEKRLTIYQNLGEIWDDRETVNSWSSKILPMYENQPLDDLNTGRLVSRYAGLP